jgi:hypothetical protein
MDHPLRNLTRWLRALAVIWVATTVLLSLPYISEADSILTCSFTDGASLTFQETGEYFPQRKPFEATLTKERFDIVFGGLDTDTPVAKGNLGEARLHVLRRSPEGIWLAELPPLGSAVHLWTVFPEAKIAMLAKHYRMGLLYDYMGILAVGRCR